MARSARVRCASIYQRAEDILHPDLPIGIFDSGVGGLTVYRALHEKLPDEHFVYLGDTARVPYGTKSLSTVERYAVENARFLEAHGIKLLVVACNTASALALPAIRESVSVPVVGVIEPGARAAVANVSESERRGVGVIATESTIKSGAYRRAIKSLAASVEVIERACPLFVALAEEGWAETDVARAVAAEYLQDLQNNRVGALVLGCTHYPILRRVIQETVGADVQLIDSGEATAASVAGLLEREGLKRTSGREEDLSHSDAPPRRLCDDLDHFYVTDAAERFARVAERFLGSAPSVLEAVEVWGHDELHAKK
ncbi:MAG: glutamate racemase [Acidobacteriota bacterium]|nr:glutamate racemase [Acidobacteriota bacterium]